MKPIITGLAGLMLVVGAGYTGCRLNQMEQGLANTPPSWSMEWQRSDKLLQEHYTETLENKDNIERTVKYGTIAAGVAGLVGGVMLIASMAATQSTTTSSSGRDPTKDDPGAFGPGGPRY